MSPYDGHDHAPVERAPLLGVVVGDRHGFALTAGLDRDIIAELVVQGIGDGFGPTFGELLVVLGGLDVVGVPDHGELLRTVLLEGGDELVELAGRLIGERVLIGVEENRPSQGDLFALLLDPATHCGCAELERLDREREVLHGSVEVDHGVDGRSGGLRAVVGLADGGRGGCKGNYRCCGHDGEQTPRSGAQGTWGHHCTGISVKTPAVGICTSTVFTSCGGAAKTAEKTSVCPGWRKLSDSPVEQTQMPFSPRPTR